MDELTERLASHDILGPAEIRDLVAKAQAGDSAARDQLVLSHWRMARKLAHKYASVGGSHDVDDLTQAGLMGVIHALRSYDSTRLLAFSTYVMSAIRTHILRALWSSTMIRIPSYYFSRRAKQVRRRFTLPDQPLGLDEQVVRRGSDDNTKSSSIGDFLVDRRAITGRHVEDTVALNGALTGLRPYARRVVQMRYLEGRTAVEVAGLLGVSHQYISAVEKDALATMRGHLSGDQAIIGGRP